MTEIVATRQSVVRRGVWLSYGTISYNLLEGVIAVAAGVVAGSISLVGFGVDSVIELGASLAALWRLRWDADPNRRAAAEAVSLRIVGISFLLLAAYVLVEAGRSLVMGLAPEESPVGIVLAALSLVVMPVLAHAKRRVALSLSSDALGAEAKQTMICMYLSAILLVGLGLNLLFGWWWADPVAALCMVPFIAREGVGAVRGRAVCSSCSVDEIYQKTM